ncbi:MAG: hypothetical protein ACOC56_01965 [Atribacterota bacterium]
MKRNNKELTMIAVTKETHELLKEQKFEGRHDNFDSLLRKLSHHWSTGIGKMIEEQSEENEYK